MFLQLRKKKTMVNILKKTSSRGLFSRSISYMRQNTRFGLFFGLHHDAYPITKPAQPKIFKQFSSHSQNTQQMNCKIKSRREIGTFSALENPAWAGASSCQPLWAALGQHGEGSPTHPAALAQQLGTASGRKGDGRHGLAISPDETLLTEKELNPQ